MNLLWFSIAVVVIVLGVCVYQWWQSMQNIRQLVQRFPVIQKAAFENVQSESTIISSLEDARAAMRRQYFQTVQKFGCAYTIDYSADQSQFVHHVSGKAPGKPIKFVMENMLLLMATILSQLEEAGIKTESTDKEPKEKFFAFEQSDLGTIHLEFKLSESQQTALQAVIASKPS